MTHDDARTRRQPPEVARCRGPPHARPARPPVRPQNAPGPGVSWGPCGAGRAAHGAAGGTVGQVRAREQRPDPIGQYARERAAGRMAQVRAREGPPCVVSAQGAPGRGSHPIPRTHPPGGGGEGAASSLGIGATYLPSEGARAGFRAIDRPAPRRLGGLYCYACRRSRRVRPTRSKGPEARAQGPPPYGARGHHAAT